jgi:hypothetical protein
MILTRRTPRLNVNNSLNSLIKIVVAHMELKDVASHMVKKLELVASLHESLLENLEHAQKKQKMTNFTKKGHMMFVGFDEKKVWIKMQKLDKKKVIVGKLGRPLHICWLLRW